MAKIFKWSYEGYDRDWQSNVTETFAYSKSKFQRPSWNAISDDIRVHKVYYTIIHVGWEESALFDMKSKNGILYTSRELSTLVKIEEEARRKRAQEEHERRMEAQRLRQAQRREEEAKRQQAEQEQKEMVIGLCLMVLYILIGVGVYFFYAEDEFHRHTFGAIMYSLFWIFTIPFQLIF